VEAPLVVLEMPHIDGDCDCGFVVCSGVGHWWCEGDIGAFGDDLGGDVVLVLRLG
jgi:hypothetical protein